MVDVDELHRQWNAWGEQDPLFAVLAQPDKRGGGWDIDEFLATGRDHIDGLLERLGSMGLSPTRGSALDFGCGVGRLTFALANHFEHVVGVDIAPSMIDLAEKLNGNGRRCRFVVNALDHLGCLDDGQFDLVVTFIVLQHMPPELAKRYLAEFVRVLAPGGVLVFQLPSRPEEIPAPEALPADGFKAQLRFSEVPSEVPARTVFPVMVTVRNDSPTPWPVIAANPLAVGNHWLEVGGSLVRQDDGRTGLPMLAAGGEVEVGLRCTAPSAPGEYLLEVDLVQEGVSWFADQGSPAVRAKVTVEVTAAETAPLAAPASPRESGDDPPRMEMFAVPLVEVVALLEAHGAVVQSINKDSSAGERWRSYEYIVTR